MKKTRPVGRPTKISREEIADAALEIGLGKATLTAIGSKLGVDHSSLYRHVKGRSDIVFAAADRAIATLNWQIDTQDNWRLYIRTAAEAVWDLYIRYPGLADAIRNMDRTPPAGIAAFSTACRRLEAFGFSPEDAALVMDSVMDMTSDSASLWLKLRTPSASGELPSEKLSRSWSDVNVADAHPYIALMRSVIEGDPKSWWLKKLDLLIEGASVFRGS